MNLDDIYQKHLTALKEKSLALKNELDGILERKDQTELNNFINKFRKQCVDMLNSTPDEILNSWTYNQMNFRVVIEITNDLHQYFQNSVPSIPSNPEQ